MHYEGKRISWLKTVGGVEKTLRFLIVIKKDKSLLNYMLKKMEGHFNDKSKLARWFLFFTKKDGRMFKCEFANERNIMWWVFVSPAYQANLAIL